MTAKRSYRCASGIYLLTILMTLTRWTNVPLYCKNTHALPAATYVIDVLDDLRKASNMVKKISYDESKEQHQGVEARTIAISEPLPQLRPWAYLASPA